MSRRRMAHIFTAEEDAIFLDLMENDPKATWRTVAEALNHTHTPRQCRDHWLTSLSPCSSESIRTSVSTMSQEEIELLFDLVSKYGTNQWQLISKCFGSERSSIELKNAYLKNMKKRMVPYVPTLHEIILPVKTKVFHNGLLPKNQIIEKPVSKRFEFNMMSLMTMLNDVDTTSYVTE